MIVKTIAAGIVAVTALSAVPANAASFSVQIGDGPGFGYHDRYDRYDRYDRHHRDWRRGRLSTEEVRWQLRRDGYRAIRFFDNRGAVYHVRAFKHGRAFVLTVNARNGQILSRHRV